MPNFSSPNTEDSHGRASAIKQKVDNRKFRNSIGLVNELKSEWKPLIIEVLKKEGRISLEDIKKITDGTYTKKDVMRLITNLLKKEGRISQEDIKKIKDGTYTKEDVMRIIGTTKNNNILGGMVSLYHMEEFDILDIRRERGSEMALTQLTLLVHMCENFLSRNNMEDSRVKNCTERVSVINEKVDEGRIEEYEKLVEGYTQLIIDLLKKKGTIYPAQMEGLKNGASEHDLEMIRLSNNDNESVGEIIDVLKQLRQVDITNTFTDQGSNAAMETLTSLVNKTHELLCKHSQEIAMETLTSLVNETHRLRCKHSSKMTPEQNLPDAPILKPKNVSQYIPDAPYQNTNPKRLNSHPLVVGKENSSTPPFNPFNFKKEERKNVSQYIPDVSYQNTNPKRLNSHPPVDKENSSTPPFNPFNFKKEGSFGRLTNLTKAKQEHKQVSFADKILGYFFGAFRK
jgi:hypothetical protein